MISQFSRGYNPLLNCRLAKPTLATLNDGASPLLNNNQERCIAMKQNVALFDSNAKEAEDFIKGLKDSTGENWTALICNSNKGRKGLANIIRYLKYFTFPFKIFLNRKKYGTIIGWQEFYGLIFAFYCRLFHVKKGNKLVIKNFIYKPKKGFIGKIYFRFMNYIVKSGYIDIYICASKTNAEYCCEIFNESKGEFVFIPFGVNDFSKNISTDIPPKNNYILSLGRSNRDWDFLIEAFKCIPYNLKIVCDELHRDELPANIEILNNVWGHESHEYIYNCKCMIVPIADGRIASGDTVLLKAMSFSKPVIITKPSCLADDYVQDGYNGIVINKDKEELASAVKRIWEDKELYENLSGNSRKHYLENHSLYTYGCNVGELLKS